MQIKKRFYAAFLVVLLTVSSLLIFICINMLSTSHTNPRIPIPDDAKWMIRLDAESYIKKEIYNTLFTEKDDAFIQQLKDIYEQNTNIDSKKKSLQIDFQEDAVVYGLERDGKNFLVIAVQTRNSAVFNEHISEYCKSNQIGRAQGHDAIFISQVSGEKSSKKELEGYLAKLVQAPVIELRKAAPEKNEFIALDVKKLPANSGFSSIKLSIQHQDRSINLDGSITYPKKLSPPMKFGLKPKGVYVYSRLIPEKLPDTLLNFLPDGLTTFKDVQAFALDFNGTYLEDTKDSMPDNYGFLLVPTMNLIIQTKSSCDVRELWNAFPKSVQGTNLSLNFGNTIYHLKQLSPNTYFIGVDPRSIIPYNGNEILSINGNLEKITKVYGGVFVTAVIENLGPVKLFNEFLKSTEFVQLKVGKKQGTNYSLQGQIKFKAEKHPLHEMTKMAFGMIQFAEQYSQMY
ncbi:hypothetical protein [Fluviicola sp.]|uniref:hypothetical protein n=1 Tax=Fluviicola sp. TaxID=1917219 RepID=UPI003D291DAD